LLSLILHQNVKTVHSNL